MPIVQYGFCHSARRMLSSSSQKASCVFVIIKREGACGRESCLIISSLVLILLTFLGTLCKINLLNMHSHCIVTHTYRFSEEKTSGAWQERTRYQVHVGRWYHNNSHNGVAQFAYLHSYCIFFHMLKVHPFHPVRGKYV